MATVLAGHVTAEVGAAIVLVLSILLTIGWIRRILR